MSDEEEFDELVGSEVARPYSKHETWVVKAHLHTMKYELRHWTPDSIFYPDKNGILNSMQELEDELDSRRRDGW